MKNIKLKERVLIPVKQYPKVSSSLFFPLPLLVNLLVLILIFMLQSLITTDTFSTVNDSKFKLDVQIIE